MTASSALPVQFGAATDPGRIRSHQEDSLIAVPPIFAVADGMGGHESGEFASGETVGALLELRERDWVTEAELLAALADAEERVRAIASHTTRAAGTTVTGVALSECDGVAEWLVFNIGDSRTYRYANGALTQLTRDHSEVQELVDSGQLSAKDAVNYPRRNVLTRAIGIGVPTVPDVSHVPMAAGDEIVICSDGLTNELGDDRIADLLQAGHDPQRTADELVAEALRAGGRDNVSVVIIKAPEPTGPGVGAVEAIVGKTSAPTRVHEDE